MYSTPDAQALRRFFVSIGKRLPATIDVTPWARLGRSSVVTEIMSSSATAIPAATIVIMRDAGDGPPELLMVERAATLAFAGGAMVFPGGRVDPADHRLAERFPALAPDEAAARVAAIRETLEETGLAIGFDAAPTMVAAIRQRCHAGERFDALLDEAGLHLDLAVLTPFARWRPEPTEEHGLPRIFDARFYLARLPVNAIAPTVDYSENVRLVWTTAADLLAAADARRVTIIYPTRRNLERLSRFADFEAAVADAARHRVRVITPRIEHRDGRAWLCIPDDVGYLICAEPVAAAVRG